MKTLLHFLIFFLLFLNLSSASTPYNQIICPDDITISCCQDYNDLELTGDPADFNSDISYFTKSDSLELDDCRVGTIIRKWTGLSVQGNVSCYQYITTERSEPFNSEINWPDDWAGVCGDEIPYTEPIYDIGFCDRVAHNFKDDTFNFIDGACIKIIRHWIIIDWCVYTPNSNSTDGKWEYTQVLMIVDKTVPEIEECPSTIIIPALNQNCSASFSLEKKATDPNCGIASPLTWYYEIDVNNDWEIDSTGIIKDSDAKIDLYNIPVGTHKIKWTVSDGCSNISTCMQTIKVIDKKPPTLFCYLSTTFNLTPMPGADTLDYPAKNFVKEAYDNCTATDDIIFSFSPDPKDSVKTFTCWDLGFQFFRIFAIDKEGNSDFAYVLVRVSINGACTFSSVEGSVYDLNEKPIQDINIALNGNGKDYLVSKTKKDGSFSFPFKDSDLDEKIGFSLSEDYKAHLNGKDIKAIIDHLLGKSKLNKFQKIAADLNDDGRISVADIRILRSLLLGKTKYSELKNTSTFFIKDEANENGFKEIKYLSNLNEKTKVYCVIKGNIN